MVSAASYPPLHRTQGRGTHSSGTGTENTEAWATRHLPYCWWQRNRRLGHSSWAARP